MLRKSGDIVRLCATKRKLLTACAERATGTAVNRAATVLTGHAARTFAPSHAVTPEGRIVITVEDSTTSSAADTFVRLHSVPGVFSVSMVYQYSDEPNSEELPS